MLVAGTREKNLVDVRLRRPVLSMGLLEGHGVDSVPGVDVLANRTRAPEGDDHARHDHDVCHEQNVVLGIAIDVSVAVQIHRDEHHAKADDDDDDHQDTVELEILEELHEARIDLHALLCVAHGGINGVLGLFGVTVIVAQYLIKTNGLRILGGRRTRGLARLAPFGRSLSLRGTHF